MKPYVRPFQKDVYDEVDTPSKQALIKVLLAEGHEIVSSKEDYYADVVSQKDGVTYYHEAERKAQWGQDYLKNKNYDQIENLFFYVFNFEYDKAWKIKATQMTDDVNHRPDFARVHKSETFYHIPYKEAELVTI